MRWGEVRGVKWFGIFRGISRDYRGARGARADQEMVWRQGSGFVRGGAGGREKDEPEACLARGRDEARPSREWLHYC